MHLMWNAAFGSKSTELLAVPFLHYMAKKKHVAVYARTSTKTNAQTDLWLANFQHDDDFFLAIVYPPT